MSSATASPVIVCSCVEEIRTLRRLVQEEKWDLLKPIACGVHDTRYPELHIYGLMKATALTPEWMTAIDRFCHNFTSKDWVSMINPVTTLPVLRHLVEKGCIHPEQEDHRHTLLLHHFIGPSHLREHLLYLLSPEVGGNINIPDGEGTTALLVYLYYQIGDAEVDEGENEDVLEMEEDVSFVLEGLELLLTLGADPLLTDKGGRSAITYVEETRGLSSRKKASLLALLRRYT